VEGVELERKELAESWGFSKGDFGIVVELYW